MFKSVTQSASERLKEKQPGVIELDPGVVAGNFGVAYPPDQPFRDTGLPEHYLDTVVKPQQSLVLPDLPKQGRAKTHMPMLTMAINRLNSMKPRSKESAQLVAEMQAIILEPLQAFDELIANLEQEYRDAWEARWNEGRVKGRAIIDSLPTLQGNVYTALAVAREAAQRKDDLLQPVQDLHLEHGRMQGNRFVTDEELRSHARKLARARAEFDAASDAALEAVQAMAIPEGELATARANLELIVRDMDQCVCELSGEAYFHPDLGLSTRPVVYRDNWS
jgi:hypothetical protein